MTTLLQELAARQRFGVQPGLETIQRLLAALGHPEKGIAAIHIAGTNGKGAVAAMCESVLRAAGYDTGRYTSPHLLRVNERFLIRGAPVTDDALETAAREVRDAMCALERASGAHVTFFECLTAIAFVLFRQAGIRLAVLECGLGGRLDATNVVIPLVAVITRIGLDHCAWLGETLAAVAAEKAGIIKPDRPVICAAMPDEARAVIAAVAARRHAPVIDAAEQVGITVSRATLKGQTLAIATPAHTLPPIRLPLAGAFQVENAATAVAALEQVPPCGLPLLDEALVTGLEQVCWPGRFQLAADAPPVVVDGGHNPDAARALRHALRHGRIHAPIGLVAGFCADKDALAFLRVLAPCITCAWSVAVPSPRTLTADRCAGLMRLAGMDPVIACASLSDALPAARVWAGAQEGLVLVCGSLFLAGAALEALAAWPWPGTRHDLNEATTGDTP